MNRSGPFDPSFDDDEIQDIQEILQPDRKAHKSDNSNSNKMPSKSASKSDTDGVQPSDEPPVSSRARMLAQQRDAQLKKRQQNTKNLAVSTFNAADPFADIAGMTSPKPLSSSHKTPTVSQFSAPRVEEGSPDSGKSSEFQPKSLGLNSGNGGARPTSDRSNMSDMLEFEAQEKSSTRPIPRREKPSSKAPASQPPVRDQNRRNRRDDDSDSQGSNEADDAIPEEEDEDDNYGNLAVAIAQPDDELDLDGRDSPQARKPSKKEDSRSITIPPRPSRQAQSKDSDGVTEKGSPQDKNLSPTASQDEQLDMRNMRRFIMSPLTARVGVLQCFIVRCKSGSSSLHPEYKVFLKSSRRFLLCAKKRPNNRTSNYILSMGEDDFDRNSVNYLGKLRSNFFGTEFQIYDHGINPKDVEDSKDNSIANVRQELGAVCYATNLLGAKGPRKMQVGLPLVGRDDKPVVWRPFKKEDELVSHLKSRDVGNISYLINKPPRWNEHVGAFVLNFNGRVTMASVKNFQLVFPDDQDRVILQFGRVGKDEFTMDFQWPMSVFQALAVTLSSFDSKIACD